MGPEFSLYDILGVKPSATVDEIKSAYRSSVLKYHPDVNKAPNAQRLTELLNEAYEILSDPTRRRAYDEAQSGSASEPGSSPPPELRDLLTCDRCGRVDLHVRFANFFRVWSIIFYTQMKGDGGVLCPGCRSSKAASSALFSATLGPWGFPWGLIYTLRALAASIRGGELSPLENAQLLRHQAVAYLQRDRLNEAKTSFKASLQFERSDQVEGILSEPFMQSASVLPPPPSWLRGQTIGLASLAIPCFLFFLFFVPHGSQHQPSTSATASQSRSTDTSSDTTDSSSPSSDDDRHGQAVALNNQALKLDEAGQHDEALALYDKGLQIDPSDAVIYANRGAVRQEKTQFDLAIADYSKAIALDPTDAKVFNWRGLAYKQKKQFDLAIADYSKAIALDPTDAKVFNWRGLVYASLKKYSLAIDDFTEAIRLKPMAYMYFNRGMAYGNSDQRTSALSDFTKAIALDPKSGDGYQERGYIEHQMGNNRLALADYLVALKSAPSNVDLVLDIAVADEMLNNDSAALAYYDRAVKVDPTIRSMLKEHSALYAAHR
jgi:tetratricopeptide (TPR) repeat protein